MDISNFTTNDYDILIISQWKYEYKLHYANNKKLQSNQACIKFAYSNLTSHGQTANCNIKKIIKVECVMGQENRIYREEFTRKKCKTAILMYCFHTAGVLHIFLLYNLLGPGISFYRKSKIISI